MADADTFLSTLIGASATLVAIIGGLLVARVVSLAAQQEGSSKLLRDADERLTTAQTRAAEAAKRHRDWLAARFLTNAAVRKLLVAGMTDLTRLKAVADCQLTDDEITPYLGRAVAEISAATSVTRTLDLPTSDNDTQVGTLWEQHKRSLPGWADSEFPDLWEEAFKLEAPKAIPKSTPPFPHGSFLPTPTPGRGLVAAQTEARHAEQIAAAHERADQRVEDLTSEHERLRANSSLERPDGMLWTGVTVLVYLTVVGIGVPGIEMSRGPRNLSQVSFLLWWFISALVVLVLFIGGCLVFLQWRAPAGTSPLPTNPLSE